MRTSIELTPRLPLDEDRQEPQDPGFAVACRRREHSGVDAVSSHSLAVDGAQTPRYVRTSFHRNGECADGVDLRTVHHVHGVRIRHMPVVRLPAIA
jgi:hypothetical protein